jgi:hypothetical protein
VPNSTEGLAHGLIEMASRVDTFDPVALRRHAVANFSLARIAADLGAAYRQLVSDRAAG